MTTRLVTKREFMTAIRQRRDRAWFVRVNKLNNYEKIVEVIKTAQLIAAELDYEAHQAAAQEIEAAFVGGKFDLHVYVHLMDLTARQLFELIHPAARHCSMVGQVWQWVNARY